MPILRRMNSNRWLLLVVLAVAGAGVAHAAGNATAGHNRYKWRDAHGALHFSDALPPDAAVLGYDIVNSQGIVVRHVDPAASPEQKAAAEADAAKKRASEQAEAKQRRTDQQMLVAYPSEDDLRRAQQRQLQLYDEEVKSARLSLKSQESALAGLLDHAAEYEHEGKAVPAPLSARIADVRGQIDVQRGNIDRKSDQRKQAAAKFDQEIARYRELKAGTSTR